MFLLAQTSRFRPLISWISCNVSSGFQGKNGQSYSYFGKWRAHYLIFISGVTPPNLLIASWPPILDLSLDDILQLILYEDRKVAESIELPHWQNLHIGGKKCMSIPWEVKNCLSTCDVTLLHSQISIVLISEKQYLYTLSEKGEKYCLSKCFNIWWPLDSHPPNFSLSESFWFQLPLYSMSKRTVNGSVVWHGYCIEVLHGLSEMLHFRYIILPPMSFMLWFHHDVHYMLDYLCKWVFFVDDWYFQCRLIFPGVMTFRSYISTTNGIGWH